MFALLRFLFIALVVLWGFCLWQEKRGGDQAFWRRARGWLLRFASVLLVIIVVGLFVERLAG